MLKQPLHAGRRSQRGLSIVEMLVGVAIGLFVVAAATMLVSTQLLENRRLLVETQLGQDLRATTDIITRELRRSGLTPTAQNGVWYVGTSSTVINAYNAITPAGSTPADHVTYRYYRNASAYDVAAFKLEDNTIKVQLSSRSGFQDLTDPRTLKVTDFSIQAASAPTTPTPVPCPKLCPDGTQACWPTVNVRELTVSITGEAVSDALVKRTLVSSVRLRNNWVRFNYPNAAAPAAICPP